MAGKRGNGEGSIRQRTNGTWEARVLLDGRSKSLYGRTRQDVAKKLAATIRDHDKGLPVARDERQTVGHYLTTWLEAVQSQIRPSSHRRYSDYVRVHLSPELGRIPLARLTPQQVQAFYARKLDEGLSRSTVHHLHGVLHRALKDALRMGLVQRNVTELVRAPRRTTREMAALSQEQAQKFLETVRGDRFEALYVLALTTGMREGELLGLRWQDVDLECATLHVYMSVQETSGRFILAEPKTAYSRRSITLALTAVEALQLHRIRQNEERLKLGAAWDTSLDLVFPNRFGGLMVPDNLAKRSFKRHLLEAGLPEIRFHDLRHTAATLLLSQGVHPKVVSETLGHADISITLRVYAHVTPNMQQAAADAMDRLFGAQST